MIIREQRILLVANCLAEHGNRRLKRLYHFIELAGVDLAKRLLGPHYGEISIMRDREVTWPDFLKRLQSLSGRKNIKAVDLFFQLHGEPGRIRFFDQWVTVAQLGREINKVADVDCLRLAYNLCCYGDSHSMAFINAGFKTAIGALKVNASAGVEYPLFCRHWAGVGKAPGSSLPVGEVLCRADRPLPRLVQDLLARRYFKNVDSTKKLKGKNTITISSI